MHLPHNVSEHGSVLHSVESDDDGIEVLNGVCGKVRGIRWVSFYY